MTDYLRANQLNIMMVLAGICFAITLCGVVSKTTRMKKMALLVMGMSATLLMVADRYAYIYRGNETQLGYYMVRICNFVTFLCPLIITHSFNWYLSEIVRPSSENKTVPLRLKINEVIIFAGVLLLIASQSTGLYYTFDEHNLYQRANGYIISAIIPLTAWLIAVTVVVQYRKSISKLMFRTLLIFSTVPILAAFLQVLLYGLSVTNIAVAALTVALRLVEIINTNNELTDAHQREKELLIQESQNMGRLLTQTASALASAIDAKDRYTNGHSRRVAEYSRKIAEIAGKSAEECEMIFNAGLLHDVGKIGVPLDILQKTSQLTDEEFEQIKSHPVIGGEILSQIQRSPWLRSGALYHHERYDGKGYPDGLKGEDIPEIARIIAVADAYDAMTSNRSYRNAIPQHIVREEFVKGIGTQFDPEYARNMLHLIDLDTEYAMKDQRVNKEMRDKQQIMVTYRRSTVAPGIILGQAMTTLKVHVGSDNAASVNMPSPSLLLFDSLDGHIHSIERDRKEMLDFEYGEIWFNGKYSVSGARKMESKTVDDPSAKNGQYTIEAARIKDHAIVRITGNGKKTEVIIALPDRSRFVYMGLTGEHCLFSDISITQALKDLPSDYIPRIAEEISFINVPAGDVPNVEMDGYRTDATAGIPVTDKLTISFHTMSLPTARLVWHCPFVCLYNSENGLVTGKNYREFSLMRLDGECWEGDPDSSIELVVEKTDEFKDWDTWKKLNLEGYDCTVVIERKGNRIDTTTMNGGISIKITTVLAADFDPIYACLTGDQCAITNIRINKS